MRMPPKEKIKAISGQQTIVADLSAIFTSESLPEPAQFSKSNSKQPVLTSVSSLIEPEESTAEELLSSSSFPKVSKLFSSSGSQNTNGHTFQMKSSCTITFVLNITKWSHLCINQTNALSFGTPHPHSPCLTQRATVLSQHSYSAKRLNLS